MAYLMPRSPNLLLKGCPNLLGFIMALQGVLKIVMEMQPPNFIKKKKNITQYITVTLSVNSDKLLISVTASALLVQHN